MTTPQRKKNRADVERAWAKVQDLHHRLYPSKIGLLVSLANNMRHLRSVRL